MNDTPDLTHGGDPVTQALFTLHHDLPRQAPGEEAGAHVTAVDLHQPFLDGLAAEAARRGLTDRVTVLSCSMDRLAFADHSFDVIWAEGAIYTVGFDHALRSWRRLLAPGGVIVVTEIEWTAADPAASVRAYWPLPESDWWEEYYTPLTRRIARADPQQPGIYLGCCPA